PGQVGLLEVEPSEIESGQIDVGKIGCTARVLGEPSLESVEIEPNRWRVCRHGDGHVQWVWKGNAGCRRNGQQSGNQNEHVGLTPRVLPPASPAPSWRRFWPSHNCRSSRLSPFPCRARTTTAYPFRGGRRTPSA